MGAVTAASTYRESMGSLTLHIFNITSASAGDTFATGLPNVVGAWAVCTTNVGTGVDLTGIGITNSSGTLTLSGSIASSAITIFVVSRT